MLFNASKTQFLHLSTRHNLPNNYPLFFKDIQLSPSALNIIDLYFTCNLNWKLHISLAKTASMKLGVLSRLRQFYSPPQLLTLYRGLIRLCMEYASHVWGGSTHTAFLNRVESKAFHLINSSPLTDCLQLLSPSKCWISRYPLSLFSCQLPYWSCYLHVFRPCCTRLSSFSHPFSAQLSNARVYL